MEDVGGQDLTKRDLKIVCRHFETIAVRMTSYSTVLVNEWSV